MIYFKSITNFNFYTIEDFTGEKPFCDSRDFGYKKKENGDIEFYTNFVACPCIYWYKENDNFCFSFDVNNVVDFCKTNNIALTDTYEGMKLINQNISKHIKASITKRYKYGVNYIENWEKVILHKDGSFEKIDNKFIPFQLEIKDNFDKFKTFLLKYKNYVDVLIAENKFRPTLTGGIDTRTFTGLYKSKSDKLDGFYLQEVKNDGKNNVLLGNLESKIAKKVADKINLPLKQHTVLDDKITITGMFNENASSYKNPNDPDYIYKFIQHGWDDNASFTNKLVPYMSNEWLEFKQHGETLKMLLLLLLAKDLIHIPYISGTSQFNLYLEGSLIYKMSKKTILSAIEILNYWGKEKVEEITKCLN